MANRKIVLCSPDWKFRQSGTRKWYKAKVPGCIHMDLYQNRLIQNPFFSLNEKKLQWIENEDWEYQLEFDCPENLEKYHSCFLEFKGLDTYADVFLNENLVLTADNMFIPWSAEVYSLLKPSGNILKIHFKSAYNTAKKEFEKLDYSLPANNDEGELKVSPFTRKAPYMYGWDWGPRLLTCGIWRNVQLNFYSRAGINYCTSSLLKLNKKKAIVQIDYELFVFKAGSYRINIIIDDRPVYSKIKELEKGTIRKTKKIAIDDPEFWWPRGYGNQKLYEIKLILEKENEGLEMNRHSIGLRKIRLNQKSDEEGTSFQFNINGKDIFIRGANIIPLEYFPSEITENKYLDLIENAISVNMNMLRAWGGGIYEDDYFYELCDQMGLLVWQDFMFACGMYPSDDLFIENITREITWQVKRLKSHPSVVLWCGNNEILEGYLTWGWKEELDEYSKDAWNSYVKIFHELIPAILKKEDLSERPYWPSSPSPGSDSSPDLSSGDFHYWDLVKVIQPYTIFSENTGRFMSEYGFKSYPGIRTVQSFLDPEDWDIHSAAMEEHQGWPTGAELVEKNIKWFYPQPKSFQHFLYISQLLQADAISYAIENHRKRKPWCMGTLYWQMNDCWPAASWSGIDYYGRWKALHYRLKTAFKDVLLSASVTDSKLLIHAVSDLPGNKKLRIHLRIIDFNGKLIAEHNSIEKINWRRAVLIYEQCLDEFITEEEKYRVVLEMRAFEGNHLVCSNLFYFVKPKYLELEKPDISMHIEKKFNKVFLFLQTKNLAKNIYLVNIKTDGFFSENYFDLLPGEDKVVVFEAKENNEYMINDFRFMSLWNCIQD
jgi:beta-mannosidase